MDPGYIQKVQYSIRFLLLVFPKKGLKVDLHHKTISKKDIHDPHCF